MIILNSTHNSPESAYVIQDYPYGFTLRCKMRVWVETATKGSGKGRMRYCAQTTNPKIVDREVWNKPKCGNYSDLIIMYFNEKGYVEIASADGCDDPSRLVKFSETYYNDLDETQKKRLDDIIKLSKILNTNSWKEFTDNTTKL